MFTVHSLQVSGLLYFFFNIFPLSILEREMNHDMCVVVFLLNNFLYSHVSTYGTKNFFCIPILVRHYLFNIQGVSLLRSCRRIIKVSPLFNVSDSQAGVSRHIGPGLYEFLMEAELQQYYPGIRGQLAITVLCRHLFKENQSFLYRTIFSSQQHSFPTPSLFFQEI